MVIGDLGTVDGEVAAERLEEISCPHTYSRKFCRDKVGPTDEVTDSWEISARKSLCSYVARTTQGQTCDLSHKTVGRKRPGLRRGRCCLRKLEDKFLTITSMLFMCDYD